MLKKRKRLRGIKMNLKNLNKIRKNMKDKMIDTKTLKTLQQELLFCGNTFVCWKKTLETINSINVGDVQESLAIMTIALRQAFIVSICKLGPYFPKVCETNKDICDKLKLLRDKYFAHIDKEYESLSSIETLLTTNKISFVATEKLLKDLSKEIFKNEFPRYCTCEALSYERLIEYLKNQENNEYEGDI